MSSYGSPGAVTARMASARVIVLLVMGCVSVARRGAGRRSLRNALEDAKRADEESGPWADAGRMLRGRRRTVAAPPRPGPML